MNERYDKWYSEFRDSMDILGDNDLFDVMDQLVGSSKSNLSLNRKLMEKVIDVSWVEAIENAIIHVDNIVRNPSRTIVDVEELVPIALSKKITVESVKHLAQHTDLIQSIDHRTGKITPSKILNVHKEESLETYENRFVNTLIDRLYIFIVTRYEKLSQISKDEEVFSMDFDTNIEDGSGNTISLKLSIDTSKSLESTNDQGFTIWQRVEKLKKMIEGYKGSELCQTLGNNFVRPPIMRTNAILKNVDLKACLALWQYILSYESAGYEINVEDTALKPETDYVDDLYKIIACNLLLFRSYTADEDSMLEIGKKKLKPIAPKIVKKYGRELLTGNYDLHADQAVGYIADDGEALFVKTVPENSDDIFEQIDKAIEIERNYYAGIDAEIRAKQEEKEEKERLRAEREARLEEKRRIEEAKREERERIRIEKEAEKQRIAEMLEKRKAEMEAEERERARLEAERLARIEEQKRLEEEARRKKEEEERIAAEKARIAEQKLQMRAELGGAEGIDTVKYDKQKDITDIQRAYSNVTGDEIDDAVAAMEEVRAAREAEAVKVDQEKAAAIADKFEHSEDAIDEVEDGLAILESDEIPEAKVSEEKVAAAAAVMSEYERNNDPRKIAAKMKIEQQRREKERKEEERAQRLKADRKYYESKPFEEIRREYSKNPVNMFERGMMRLLYKFFGYIPKDTDNPDYKRILAKRAEEAEIRKREDEERNKMEVYYRKYSTDTKYQIRRDIADIKFKRKKKKEARNKPKPQYVPPKRTPEEQAAIDKQMKALYKEYRVGLIEQIRRSIKAMSKEEKEREFKQALGEK
ncbi:MAG: DUF2357 domain-containing protein [Clostridiales bacterium]|nr:DUF2357 domain-containing protein [Clostridiales bacterium]